MAVTDRPIKGQRVYSSVRKAENRQPNGVIVRVDHAGEDVYVEYHETPPELEILPLDAFFGTWTDKFGGGWHIQE